MSTFTRFSGIGVSFVVLAIATTAQASDINWQKVSQQLNRASSRALTVRNASYQIPQQYAQLRNQITTEAGRMMVFLDTVSQNATVVQQNPDREQSRQWAIEYARRTSDSAEKIEDMARELKRAADRADDHQTEQFAQNLRRLADDVDDAISKVRREID